MNKETIYIEPSEDITDILSRIKASDKKVIALVPPKKPAVLLSSVNIKLISRAAKADKKAIVLVTTDDSLTKLAMTANLPVAPSLKSRPVMPGEENDLKTDKETDDSSAEPDDDEEEKDEGNEFEDDEPESEDSEEDTDENDEDANNEEDEDDEGDDEEDDGGKDEENEDDEEDDEDAEDDSEDDEEEKSEKKEEKKSKKSDKASAVDEKKSSKKSKKSDKERSSGFAGFLSQRKFWLIGGFVVAICVAAFLVWAFTIAPRVSVSVSVRTSSSNFSENVTFTKNSADEDSSIGSFYLHEEKIEKDQAVKFTATGKKDLGEVASGELVLYAYFLGPGSVKVAAGSTFSHGTLNYTTLTDVTLSGPADTKAKTFNATCDNYSDDFEIGVDYCQVSATVSIKAAAPGEDYNISATNEGWTSSVGNVSAANHDITGGTSRIVTVVQQSDVDLALDKLKSEGSVGSKEELYGKLSDTVMPIEASFKVSTSEPQTVPGVGQEVEEGVTPQVSTKTVYSVYTIDRVRMEEFIKAKATVDEGKRLYSYGEPFIEYYAESSKDVYTAKLKTTYKVGPEISETEVLDKIRGEKIGRIEPILKDAFSGISSVKFEKSYFWVNSIPNDENKVEIKLTIEGEDEK